MPVSSHYVTSAPVLRSRRRRLSLRTAVDALHRSIASDPHLIRIIEHHVLITAIVSDDRSQSRAANRVGGARSTAVN